MPFEPSNLQGDIPNKPHLALRTASEEAISIPPGAYLMQVLDPTSADGYSTFILTKVTDKKWTFRCACSPNCKKVREMVAVEKGTCPR
jgi:hypothetical protein